MANYARHYVMVGQKINPLFDFNDVSNYIYEGKDEEVAVVFSIDGKNSYVGIVLAVGDLEDGFVPDMFKLRKLQKLIDQTFIDKTYWKFAMKNKDGILFPELIIFTHWE